MKIHKGDTVKIISGKDKGKTGKVMRAIPEKNSLIIEGINVYKKHQRPKKQGEKGEIVNVVRPLLISKVMLLCSSCKKATRTGQRLENDNKIRYCKKCDSSI